MFGSNRKVGRPHAGNVPIYFRAPLTLEDKAKAEADRLGISLSDYIRNALREKLGKARDGGNA